MQHTKELRDTLVELSLKVVQQNYIITKRLAGILIKQILSDDVIPGTNESILQKLKILAGKEGIIQIGSADGNGNDGHGYYIAHLMLNITNFEANDLEHTVYLCIQYVPEPEAGHSWDNKEFSELSELCNFSKALVLLQYMEVFIYYHTCRIELHRLAEREYSTCVNLGESGGLSFF